jgi:pimeloyl-ACP methyl ester carboxylesterase
VHPTDVTHDLRLDDGRTLAVRDAGAPAPDAPVVVWHHGSPHTGALVGPLRDAAMARGVRLVSYARPSYGGSTPAPGRCVADAAADVRALADALGVDRFAVMGSSGGGPHALACAALLGDRVTGVASLSGLAPRTDEFDWYAGMASDGALRAAANGRDARAEHEKTAEFDAAVFTDADWAALAGAWGELGEDAGRANEHGSDGLVDDDVAFAHLWGFDVGAIDVPVLVVHGGADRMVPASHAQWLIAHLRRPELWLRPLDGHVSVLDAVPLAFAWLLANRAPTGPDGR